MILVGILDTRRVDLGDLVTKKVDLSGSSSFVAAQFGQRQLDRSQLVEHRRQRSGIDPTEAVERTALHGGLQQRLMRMLAMQVDQVDTLLGEGADRRKVPVDVHATAPFARDDPTDNQFVVAELESALNLGFGRTRTHERRVGPTAGEKVDRADDEGFAGTGFAGDGGHPAVEDERQFIDDPEVTNQQFGQHTTPRERA